MTPISNIIKVPIVDFPHHFAGSDGHIHREDCIISGSFYRGLVFAKGSVSNTYIQVYLRNENGVYGFMAHRLICAAFHENIYNLPFVNHRDADILNNKPTNLEWCTQSWNIKWACILKEMDREELFPIGNVYQNKFNDKTATSIRRTGRYMDMDNGEMWCLEEIRI